jgi:hypothetical protein
MSQSRIKLTDTNVMSFKNLMRDECHVIDLDISSQISPTSQAFPKFVNLCKLFSFPLQPIVNWASPTLYKQALTFACVYLSFAFAMNNSSLLISLLVRGFSMTTLMPFEESSRSLIRVKHPKLSIKPCEESHLSMMFLCFFNMFRLGKSLAVVA